MLLISEDLDEILASPTVSSSCTRGAIVGEVAAERPTSNEIGLLMAGGRRA